MADIRVCDKCREPLGQKRMVVAFYPYGGMELPPVPHLDLCLPCWRDFLHLLHNPGPPPSHLWITGRQDDR